MSVSRVTARLPGDDRRVERLALGGDDDVGLGIRILRRERAGREQRNETESEAAQRHVVSITAPNCLNKRGSRLATL